MKAPIAPDIHKLNRFIIRVARIHMGHKELSSSLMDYRKAGLALIEQGISDTLCSLDQDLISREILDQVEVLFHYLSLTSQFEKSRQANQVFFIYRLGVLLY